MPMANVEVAWEIARDRAFASIVQKGEAIARPELGHSVHVEANGLDAGPRVLLSLPRGQRGQPDGPHEDRAAARRSPSTGCDSGSAAATTTRRATSRRSGASRRNSSTSSSTPATTSTKDAATAAGIPRSSASITAHEIYTVVDYRNRYAQYKSDPDFRAAHASAPFVITWDDHEVDNDYAGDLDENGTPPEVFLLRRAAAYQAFFESMPLRATPAAVGTEPRACTAACGSARSSISACSTRGSTAPIRRAMARAPRAAPPRSIRRGRSSARRRSSGCSSSSRRRARRGRSSASRCRPSRAISSRPTRRGATRWTSGTATSRRARASTRGSRRRRRPTPIVLSGDVHVHFGADLKMDFENPRSETVGVEFTNSAITSGGDGAEVSGELGGHAGRQPAHQVPQRPARLRRLHRHAEGDARGLQGARSGHAAGRPGTHGRHSRRRSWKARGGACVKGPRRFKVQGSGFKVRVQVHLVLGRGHRVLRVWKWL